MEHLRSKELARKAKNRNKEDSKKTPDLHVITFDLEQVLSIPKSPISSFYYRWKLNMYNLMIYCLGNAEVKCYVTVWPKYEGRRGASEIGSCLINYIKYLLPYIKNVILYSDCCAGQSRHKYMSYKKNISV